MRPQARFSRLTTERSSTWMLCPACSPPDNSIPLGSWFTHVHNAHPQLYRTLYGSATPPLPQDAPADHAAFARDHHAT